MLLLKYEEEILQVFLSFYSDITLLEYKICIYYMIYYDFFFNWGIINLKNSKLLLDEMEYLGTKIHFHLEFIIFIQIFYKHFSSGHQMPPLQAIGQSPTHALGVL